MAFASLLSLVALAAVARAAPTSEAAVCSDGTRVTNAACCAFIPLAQDLQENVLDGECGETAHEILRLTFHDAIGISQSLGPSAGTGADGSVLLFPTVEPEFFENDGISDSVNNLLPFLQRHDVTAGDLVQFAGAVALTNCPGAPRVQFLAGRPNATHPSINGLVPEPQDSVDTILDRFADAGNFSPFEVISLLASHSIARADKVDLAIDAAPFDSTPFVMDTQIFLEVLLKGVGLPGPGNSSAEVLSPLPVGSGNDTGELRLQSDFALARDSRTACFWQGFVNQQDFMATSFKNAFEKLAVLGQNTKKLIDCSDAVPPASTVAVKPASFPATKGPADLEIACDARTFPTLTSDRGATETLIPHCPDGSQICADVDTDGPATDNDDPSTDPGTI
ncbi:manganese peroxidase isozyme 2 precursor [Punctularia strigosozonata HHB-11173 SS5]|uniref:manganese peroxidase isozyme 2 precursor n=1 Tax=Punctularia strigosozonata (strain HHB-11173) TaxID=741275 RepID=UPI000441660B|nr:manganese peroxidase isozyme 2 precursor [Punctularia strigosozonata HHB-11173 SS5]EIN09043.1 manganese peroxidase isozyme 2 precursor [Punctularia strigosozonata HHB-11173 SS5]